MLEQSFYDKADVIIETHGAKPVAVTVLVDKKGINDINNVPIKSLIKINKVG